jgi:N,N'-diacetyllegionaminate synthase
MINGLVKVGRRKIGIGRGQKCFIAAEIGINHNGSVKLAKETMQAAKRCGADAVKFQNYKTEDFLSDRQLQYRYTSSGKKMTESQFDMFKRCELKFKEIKELKEYCDKIGIIFFCTPSGVKGVYELQKLGVKLLKNSSDNINNFTLIRSMAETAIPLVISSGMSTISEIRQAVKVFEGAGGKDLIILHCVSLYPTPAKEVNLLKMARLISEFSCPIGLSDHSVGNIAAVGAVALGASFVEKHFTLDKTLPGPDHWFSADPEEFESLVSDIRQIEFSLGRGGTQLSAAEKEARMQFRLSCVAACDIKEGEIISEKHLCLRRPGNGIPADKLSYLIGKKAVRFLPERTVLKENDFC